MEHALTVLYPTPTHQRLAFGYEVMMDAHNNRNNHTNHNLSSYMITISFTSTTPGCCWAGLLFQFGLLDEIF